jgi:hypothetical protein
MVAASNNPYPSVLFVEGSAPSSPAATNFRLYYDSSDHLLKWKNSAGTVTTIATGTPLSDPMTTRGDIIVRNASNATARLAIGLSGKVLSSDGTDISWQTPTTGFASGTAFPGSPATNDLFYRTNIFGGTLFKYDGTRWRSHQTFSRTIEIDNVNFSIDTPTAGITVSQEAGWAGIPFAGTYDVYCLTCELVTLVAGTNDGSHFWTVTLYKRTPAQAATALGNITTAADTLQVAASHSIAVNAVIASAASTHNYWGLNPGKTSTPGPLYVTAEVFYQIIAT